MWNTFESIADVGGGLGGEALGVYLHAEQDSYSHAGFGALFGHLIAGHAPDKTYTDPSKADTMSRDTYGALLQAGVKIGTEAGPVPLAQIMPFVRAFNRATTKDEKDKQLGLLRQTVDQYRKSHSSGGQSGATGSNPIEEDRASQCNGGNPAACDH